MRWCCRALFARRGCIFCTFVNVVTASAPTPKRPFAPLLLLLRRVAVDPHPSDAQQAHTTRVMEEFCRVAEEEDGNLPSCSSRSRRGGLFGDDQPEDDARDECVRLLEYGAGFYPYRLLRVIRECVLGEAITPRHSSNGRRDSHTTPVFYSYRRTR
jgi:hypothetical protein